MTRFRIQVEPPLRTSMITELEFRRLAGLCVLCGIHRAIDPPGRDLCDPCENSMVAKENRRLFRRIHKRRAA